MQWSQGTTHLQASITVPFDLTAVASTYATAIKLYARPSFPLAVYAPLAGVATGVTNASGGVFTYQFATADVATPGNYLLSVRVTYSDGDSRSFELAFVITQTQ